MLEIRKNLFGSQTQLFHSCNPLIVGCSYCPWLIMSVSREVTINNETRKAQSTVGLVSKYVRLLCLLSYLWHKVLTFYHQSCDCVKVCDTTCKLDTGPLSGVSGIHNNPTHPKISFHLIYTILVSYRVMSNFCQWKTEVACVCQLLILNTCLWYTLYKVDLRASIKMMAKRNTI